METRTKMEKDETMTVIGWKKGKERVLHTDNPEMLRMFAEAMDRVEYICVT